MEIVVITDWSQVRMAERDRRREPLTDYLRSRVDMRNGTDRRAPPIIVTDNGYVNRESERWFRLTNKE